MPTRAEELRQKLDALKAVGQQADRQATDLSRMREQISGLQASATSADKAVTVTAGPSGSITNIEFSQDAMRQSPSQLSSTVLNTLRQAVAEAAKQQAEIIGEHLPNSDVVERVMSTQEEMFGGIRIERPEPTSRPPQQDRLDEDMPDSFLDGRGY